MNTMRKIAFVAAAFLLAACTSNDDIGVVSTNYLKVNDVVVNGNLSSVSLHIDADCSWKITEDVAWLTVSPIQGDGPMDVTLTTGANPSSVEERSCQLTITSDGGLKRVISLSQTKNNESLEVSTNEMSFGENGGKLSFTVTSNTKWDITGGADWLTLDITTGLNDGEVAVTAAATTLEMDRTATLTITGNSGTARQVNITQVSKNVILTIQPEIIDANAKGSTQQFFVASNTDWTVTSDVTWVTVNVPSGSNDGQVTVTLPDNVTSEARVAHIRVVSASGRQQQTCTITQAAATVPSLTQPVINGIERYKANFSSSFTSSLDITECGFCYSTTPNPTVNDKVVRVTGQQGMSGDLNVNVSELTSGTTYYVRAWARNANGTNYSSDATFTTEGTIPGGGDNPTPSI